MDNCHADFSSPQQSQRCQAHLGEVLSTFFCNLIADGFSSALIHEGRALT